MRARVGSALIVVACGAGLRSQETLFDREPLDRAATMFIVAHDRQDVILSLLDADVVTTGIEFPDKRCRELFPSPAMVRDREALAECLTPLSFERDRPTLLHDVALLTGDHGVQFAARFTAQGRVSSIGFTSRGDTLTISERELASHRFGGRVVPLDSHERGQLDRDLAARPADQRAVFAWFDVCIGTDGAITLVELRATSALPAVSAFVETIKTWQHEPFIHRAEPTPVCALVHMGADAVTPFPLSVEVVGATPWALEWRRVAGDRTFVPDEETRAEIVKAGGATNHGLFMYCVNTSGTVTSIQMQRSTGRPAYDQTVMRTIRRWRFEPLVAGDKPIQACAYIGAFYSQH